VVTLRHGERVGRFVVADCARPGDGTAEWMTDRNIAVEIDHATALRWGVVGELAWVTVEGWERGDWLVSDTAYGHRDYVRPADHQGRVGMTQAARQFRQGERHSYALADEDRECFRCPLDDCTAGRDTPHCPIMVKRTIRRWWELGRNAAARQRGGEEEARR